MIRALAMDDEPLALRLLGVFAAKIPDLEIAAACTDTEQARTFLDKVDVIFADINMPLQSGMDFVASLENPPLVVFTTASQIMPWTPSRWAPWITCSSPLPSTIFPVPSTGSARR